MVVRSRTMMHFSRAFYYCVNNPLYNQRHMLCRLWYHPPQGPFLVLCTSSIEQAFSASIRCCMCWMCLGKYYTIIMWIVSSIERVARYVAVGVLLAWSDINRATVAVESQVVLENYFMNPPFSQTRLQALLELGVDIKCVFANWRQKHDHITWSFDQRLLIFASRHEKRIQCPSLVGIYDFGKQLYEPTLFPNTPPGTFKIYDLIISEKDFRNPTGTVGIYDFRKRL